MATTRIGLIRVVSFADPEVAGLHGGLIERHFPDLQVTSRCIPDQPKGIYDDATEEIAVPKIVELGRVMAREDDIQALIVSCAADPAVKELRRTLAIPVIGAGSAAAALALAISDRVGTLGITEDTPGCMKAVLGGHLVGEARPEGVRTTLDLMNDAGKKSAFGALRRLVEARAGVIALACTGFSTVGIAGELQERAGIRVIDAVVAAGLCAWHFTRPGA